MDIDVAVIGGGAAGLSAALVLGRACREVVVFDNRDPRNRSARQMHGFLSRDGTPPAELLAIGREQLRGYQKVAFEHAEVSSIEPGGDRLTIVTEDRTFHALRVLMATGMRDELPSLDGLNACWGISAFTCPYCDGWEVRDQPIATWGTTRSSVELAQELMLWTRDIVICQGLTTTVSPSEREWLAQTGARVAQGVLRRLIHTDGELQALEFEDGTTIERSAIFFSAPLVQRSALPEALGCAMNARGHIAIDDEHRTSVAGVYAAGDAVTHLHQVMIAAASGAKAAIGINNDLLCAFPPV